MAGVRRQINPFTVSSGCKVRYEAEASNETLQSSEGRAIKARIKLMELVISDSIKGIGGVGRSFRVRYVIFCACEPSRLEL